MTGKRGQITLFIILGIVILFSVGFVLYMRETPEFDIIPKDETPIGTYVRECIEDVGETAVKILATQGGYIEIPNDIALNPRSHLALNPGGEPIVPFWYYRGQNNIPSREFMQNEISNYVVRAVDFCLDDFEPFKQEYEITKFANVSASTTIGESSVLIRLNYPINARDLAKGSISKLDTFGAELQVGLGRMHDLAKDLMRAENSELFFERETINLMTMNPDIPFTGMTVDCTPDVWYRSNIINQIQDVLYWNIPRIRVKSTTYQPYRSEELYAKNHFLWDATDKKYRDLKASFRYLQDWGLEFRSRPGGEILRSNAGRAGTSMLRFLCFNLYHFTYDVRYPLLGMIRDDSSFNGEGLIFNFAFPVLIDHNEGNRADLPIVDSLSPELSHQFCNEVSPQTVDVRAKDYYTLEELYHANITYSCIRYTCELGQTVPDSNKYRLLTQLPEACSGGVLFGNAPGYLEGFVQDDGSGRLDIIMKPLQKFAVSFTNHRTDDFSRTSPIDTERQQVSVHITGPEGFEEFMVYPGEDQEIELIQGDATYNLDLIVIEDEERIVGGYTGKWSVKYSELINKNALNFKIAQYIPIPITVEQQADAALYLDENTEYKNVLRPVFS
ncbi:hypothetical protein ACFLZ7_01205 [Nanoarchaeota archaeon]